MEFKGRMIEKRLLAFSLSLVVVFSILNVNVTSSSPGEYPSIYVEPAIIKDEALTAGENFTISIKTDYTGDDITAWQFALSYNPNVLHGGIETTEAWTGNGVTPEFNTTQNPVVQDSEKVYVNETLKSRVRFGEDAWTGNGLKTEFVTTGKPVVADSEAVYVDLAKMTKPENYTIDYDTGTITFTEPPGIGLAIQATYDYGHYTIDYDTGTITFTEPPGIGDNIKATYQVLMIRNVGYTIDYDTGTITFTEPPGIGEGIKATYDYGHYTTDYTILPNKLALNMTITFTEPPGIGDNIKATYLYGGVTNGDLITKDKHPTAEFTPGPFNNTEGKLSLTGAFFFFYPWLPPPFVTSGPGTLANVTFIVIDYGASDIIFGNDTELIGWNFTTNMEYPIIDADVEPEHIEHGYFSNKIVGDVDGDHCVDCDDFYILCRKYDTNKGDSAYDLDCDLDNDGDVDSNDVSLFSGEYGQSA